MKRKLAAIFYADVSGYSRLVGADEEGTHRVFRAHFDRLHSVVRAHGGRVVNTAGDALLAEFASVVTALRCAVEAQRDLALRNRDLTDDHKLQFRVGINFGDVIVDRDDLYGNGVNVAARLESLADPGGICISSEVLDQVEKNVDVGFAFIGVKHVKNIEKPVTAYKVLFDSKDAGKVVGRQPARILSTTRWRLALVAVIALAILAGGLISRLLLSRPDLPPVPMEQMALPLPDKPSIAVLPFDNLGGLPDQDYFAAGLTDDLITELSKVSGLFVIARNSVFAFEEGAGLQEIAADLGVRYVLEGTLRRTDSTIRINTQLIDVTTGRYMWAERYDRDYSDLFVLQDDVIDHIISAMSVHVTATERDQLHRVPTRNLEAYDNYLRAEQEGVYFTDVESYRRALSFYQRAIELDPSFAEAHAGIARIAVDVWRRDYNFLWSAAVARKIAYDAAGRALELDMGNARAHSVLALLQLVDGRREEAVASARKAVDLRPNDAEGHGNLGLVLVHSGQLEEGVAEIETALRLDPGPPPFFELLAGVVYYHAGIYDRAITRLEPARAALPQSEPAREYLAAAYTYHGDESRALEEAGTLLNLFPTTNLTYYRYLYDYWEEEQRRHHIEGLRRAGIPTWPFGFEGRQEDRLDAEELTPLIVGATWAGRHRNGTPFMQHFDEAGNVAYQTANTFTTGIAYLEDDMLCQRLDGILLDRAMCGYVYRNARPAADPKHDYILVSPDALKYFSLDDEG